MGLVELLEIAAMATANDTNVTTTTCSEYRDPTLPRNQRIWSAIVGVLSDESTEDGMSYSVEECVGRGLTKDEAWVAARAAMDARPEVISFSVRGDR